MAGSLPPIAHPPPASPPRGATAPAGPARHARPHTSTCRTSNAAASPAPAAGADAARQTVRRLHRLTASRDPQDGSARPTQGRMTMNQPSHRSTTLAPVQSCSSIIAHAHDQKADATHRYGTVDMPQAKLGRRPCPRTTNHRHWTVHYRLARGADASHARQSCSHQNATKSQRAPPVPSSPTPKKQNHLALLTLTSAVAPHSGLHAAEGGRCSLHLRN